MLKIGSTTPQKFYVGNTLVKKLYMGNQLVYSAIPDLPFAPARTIEYDFVRGNLGGDDQRLIDLAGNNHMTLGDASTAEATDPVWTSEGIYNSGDDFIKGSRTPYQVNQMTMLAIVNPASVHDGIMFTVADNLSFRTLASGTTRVDMKRSDGGYTTRVGPSYTANSKFVFSFRKNAMTLRVGHNKTYTSQGETANFGFNNADVFFFRHINGNTYFDGAVAYYLYYNYALTDAEFDQAYDYLVAAASQKHGITLGNSAPLTTPLPPFMVSTPARTAKSLHEASTIAGHIERYTNPTEFSTMLTRLAESNFANFRGSFTDAGSVTRGKQIISAGMKLSVGIDPDGGTIPRQYNPDGTPGNDPYWSSPGRTRRFLDDQLLDYGVSNIAFVAQINEPDLFVVDKRRDSQGTLYDYSAIDAGGNQRTEYYNFLKEITEDTQRTLDSNAAFAELDHIGPAFARQGQENSYDTFGNMSAWLDLPNSHTYTGSRPPETAPWGGAGYAAISPWHIDRLQKTTVPNATVYATDEGGSSSYDFKNTSTGEINETLRAKYLMRYFMYLHKLGFKYITTYEFHDGGTNTEEREQMFGLLYNNLTPKVSYTALKNMLGLLKDPGVPFTTGSLAFALSGSTANVMTHLLQKRDGSFWLGIWLAVSGQHPDTHVPSVVSTQDVTINFNAAKTVVRYNPLVSTSAISNDAGITSKTITVDDGMTLLKIT